MTVFAQEGWVIPVLGKNIASLEPFIRLFWKAI